MPMFRAGVRSGEFGDRELAAFLADKMLLEIRAVTVRSRARSEEMPPAEAVDRIHDMADFCHDMLSISRSPRRRPSRRVPTRREQALSKRPMSYRWSTCGPERRAWILRHIDRAGLHWTPPPPLPTPRKGVPALSGRQRLSLLAGWAVKTPPGRRRLPRQARVLKALDREAIFDLYQEAGRLRLGLGEDSPWLHAHLAPDALHYVFPDPADYYWPAPETGRRWWECRVLLTMVDGEQVSGTLAVLPETFTALPSTLSRYRQRRLALLARLTERDASLWGRDHSPVCGPESCGYTSPDTPATG